MRRTVFVVRMLIVLGGFPAFGADGIQLGEDNFDEWFRTVVSQPEEMGWSEIPWRDQYWQAIVEAQEKGLPVLLWAMNGHPLGCT